MSNWIVKADLTEAKQQHGIEADTAEEAISFAMAHPHLWRDDKFVGGKWVLTAHEVSPPLQWQNQPWIPPNEPFVPHTEEPVLQPDSFATGQHAAPEQSADDPQTVTETNEYLHQGAALTPDERRELVMLRNKYMGIIELLEYYAANASKNPGVVIARTQEQGVYRLVRGDDVKHYDTRLEAS